MSGRGRPRRGKTGVRDVGREEMCVEEDGLKEGGRGGRRSGAGYHKSSQGRPLGRRGSKG